MPEKGHYVREFMTAQVVTIGMDQTLRDAQDLFKAGAFHHLVVTEAGKVVGVLSDRDVLRSLSPFIDVPLSERPQDRATLQKRIHQFMTRRLISIHPDATLAQAARLFMRQRVSCVPVLDEDKQLVGILTTRDLLRWVVLWGGDGQSE